MISTRVHTLFPIAGARVFIGISVRPIVIVVATGQSEREDPVAAISKLQQFVWEQRKRFRTSPPIDPSSRYCRPAFEAARGRFRAVSKFDLLMELEELLAIVGVKSHHGSL